MKKVIGYIFLTSPMVVLIGIVGFFEWKMMLQVLLIVGLIVSVTWFGSYLVVEAESEERAKKIMEQNNCLQNKKSEL